MTNAVCNRVFSDVGLPEDIKDAETLKIISEGLAARSSMPSTDTLLQEIASTEEFLKVRSERQLVVAQLEAEERQKLRNASTTSNTDICDERWELWLADGD